MYNSERCILCDVPFSTDKTRRFCIYCNYSRDAARKLQSVIFPSDGISRLFKIPTFKKVFKNSLSVKLNEMFMHVGKDNVKFERIGADLFLRITKKSGEPIPPGYSIVVEWEDSNTNAK